MQSLELSTVQKLDNFSIQDVFKFLQLVALACPGIIFIKPS
jgi:hypothetical protein